MNFKKFRNKNILLLGIILAAVGMTMLASAQIGGRTEKIENVATPSNETVTKAATPSESIKKDTYTGFKTENGYQYYYKDGEKIKNELRFIKGELYYFDQDGKMKTGWHTSEKTGLVYYFDGFGESQTGWILDEDAWYYLENHKLATGWKMIESDDGSQYWFYFDESGRMYANCETPDGYYVNEDGVWIENPNEPTAYEEDDFGWNKEPNSAPGQLSGLTIAGNPAEFYMLCIAGETSGLANLSAVSNGDRGRAYGICQLDYRYDLVGFMNFAYEKHPDLWPAFSKYLNYSAGNPDLKSNSDIGNAFIAAMEVDYETAISDQLEYMSMKYWNSCKEKMNEAGFDLDNRHIAVSAALFSVNVNCGTQPNIFINNLSPDMTDEEMIRGIYHLRNTVFARQKVGSAFKGTTTRYKRSEPQMALDLLYGYITIDSHKNYGGGVEWHGNPFYDAITTVPNEGSILYEEELIATPSEATPKKRSISFTQSETESAESTEIIENTEETKAIEESLVETQSINEEESDAINETNSTIYEVNDDDLVQLDDGTWVSREEYGPGFVYIETEAAAEETTASESEEQPIENPVPETMPEETEVNIIIMETKSAIGPGMNID